MKSISTIPNPSLRWLAAVSCARSVIAEFADACITKIELTPHGAVVEFVRDGHWDDSWAVLIEQQKPGAGHLHCTHQMIASNALQWAKQRSGSWVDTRLSALAKAEITLLEWSDGALWWSPGIIADEAGAVEWSIHAMQQADDGRISLELLVAGNLQQMKRLKKLMKICGSVPEFSTSAWEEQAQILNHYAKMQGNTEALWPNYAACEIAEQIEVWADSVCAGGGALRNKSTEPECSSFGVWSDGFKYNKLGKLSWLPSADGLSKKQWLQRLMQRLRLLGLECQPVLCGGNGAAPSGTEAAILLKLCRDMAICPKISTSYDDTHGIPQDLGTLLVWRVLDPMGASWPIAFVGVANAAKRRWLRARKKHKESSGCMATEQWLGGAFWWFGSDVADLATEVWLLQARGKVIK